VGSARLGRLVWPGMILAGLCLGLAVLAAWPEPTTRIVRLPYGESQPKTPREVAPAPATVTAKVRPAEQVAVVPRAATRPPQPAATVEPEVGRVLAAIEPEPDTTAGPPPVPSELELDDAYEQESPEELGAKPLPGVVGPSAAPTPSPPPVAG
jgi:hypothetical protein